MPLLRGLVIRFVVLVLLAGCGGADEPPPVDAPAAREGPRHVVLVLIGSLRADHVGIDGHDQPTTPHLDGLARRGLVHERAYAASSDWGASLSALLCGRYPASVGATGRDGARPHREVPTLARLSARAGRRTLLATNEARWRERAFTRGCDELLIDSVPGRWDAERVTDGALELVDGSGEAPLTLIVEYADAGEPHLPAPAARRRMDAPEPAEPLTLPWLREHAGTLPPGLAEGPGLADLRARYDAEIAQVDGALGRLLAGLESRGVLDDALVVVTSLHGLEFLEHGYVGAGWSLHEEVLRVPLVLVAPGQLEPGRRDDPVSLVDVLPTLLALPGWEGSSLDGTPAEGLPLLATGSTGLQLVPRRGPLLAELLQPGLAVQRAVIDGDWQLIEVLTDVAPAARQAAEQALPLRVAAEREGLLPRSGIWGPPRARRLFDLSADPALRGDLGPTQPGRVEALGGALRAYEAWCVEFAPAPREALLRQELPELDDEQIRQLEQLGYL